MGTWNGVTHYLIASSTIHIDDGGARRDRTADLLHAMQALSQLSYSPKKEKRIVNEGLFGCQVIFDK